MTVIKSLGRLALVATISMSMSAVISAQGAKQLTPQQIFTESSRSVVTIFVVDSSGSNVSLGSGFVAAPNGLVITNQHVVRPDRPGVRLAVKLPSGETYDDVSVVYVDDRRDFALLAIRASGLVPLRIGDSDSVQVGDDVVAVGSPMGLELTFTRGTVSNIRLSPDGYKFIQHQTPISGGSSGSPLLNMKGEVVGINTFMIGESQNLNGAVPINYAKPYFNDAPQMTYQAYVQNIVGTAATASASTSPSDSAQPATKAEDDDYKEFFDAPRDTPQKQIELGEAFLAKYPDSRYRASVYARMVNAYLALGDVDKLFVAGEKALELNPDNVDVLAVVAYAVPRRIKPEDLDAAQKLQKVEQYSKHAVEVLNGLPKPETLTEEEFTRAKNEKLSMAHSGLAMVAFHRNNFAGMASELEQATTLSAAPDPSDFYLLGVAYDRVKRHGDAATAFGKCAAVAWDFQDRCKQSQEQSLKQAGVQPKP
ncbi:MAG: trypsin-like peptidase domain-containing protein [Candidatus Acidiferrales bacterium]